METSRCDSILTKASGKDVCCRRFVQYRICGCHHGGSTAVVEDPLIVSDLVYLDDAQRVRIAGPGRRGRWMCSASSVEDAVCRRYGVVSTSPPGLTRMMDVIVVVCHEFELTVSEKQADAMHLWSDPRTASNAAN